MTLETSILNVLSVPLTYPQIEQAIYPKGRPDTWADLITLGLQLERMVNRGVVHKLDRHSRKVSQNEKSISTTGMCWPVYSAHPISKGFKAPFMKALV